MGYEIHVTRATDWSNNNGHEITLEEWLAYVEKDPELELDREHNSARSIYAIFRWHGPNPNKEYYLDWCKGNINTKNPDQDVLGKMLQLAHFLGGKVQGDEGETITSVTEVPSDEELQQLAVELWRANNRGLHVTAGVIACVGVIAYLVHWRWLAYFLFSVALLAELSASGLFVTMLRKQDTNGK